MGERDFSSCLVISWQRRNDEIYFIIFIFIYLEYKTIFEHKTKLKTDAKWLFCFCCAQSSTTKMMILFLSNNLPLPVNYWIAFLKAARETSEGGVSSLYFEFIVFMNPANTYSRIEFMHYLIFNFVPCLYRCWQTLCSRAIYKTVFVWRLKRY